MVSVISALRILVTNLMQRVRDLEDQAEYEPPDVIELRELRSQNHRLEIQIKGLRKENNDLRARLGHSRRTARVEEALDRKIEVLNPLSQIKSVAMHTFEYEWYLIGSKGRGRFTIRYRDGSRAKGSYSYEEYYTDRIGVDVFFKNASDQPASFSIMIGAGATIRSMFRAYQNVLGKVACTTPVFQRGEVHQIIATVRVPDTRKINAVGVGRVTSTSYPREE